ncbi:DUF2410 superfamily domain-containing protein [Histoplasma capsulatum]|uniref:DUF2410 superfamily domain-containing protein n=1 Tax=Ajellomyces capsulatus TaxID=5037 RepID=A0A8A1M3C3_AJECA|nr:conserved hypothetical protein [Histoplasma mississippiense (nom. inval.)]EDN07026.1 conserved hypothetical protein [Histoplasma mississippiense (nom. inval.)]QSS60948.1 DUF2410 superfamily domain-containing protein [Histoplasma capsulatum]
MATPMVGGPLRSEGRKSIYTTTALKRWSCQSADELPAVAQIKAIHVYDFDNTLFSSPLPNPQLWNGPTIGFLSTYECFANGGWWHDPNILAATGQGMEIEERKAWKGWWNEQIVQLVELSMQQKDALTVLLTGRAEGPFENIIKRMIKSRKLVFDLVCLKPEVGPNSQRFSSTMNFKQTFLEDLVITYKHADEIRVYEDRVKHVKGFREYFEKLNRALQPGPPSAPRKPINAEVIQVAEEAAFLPPVTEAAEVQRMINYHNKILTSTSGNTTKSPYGRLRIKRTIFFTAYLLSNTDSSRIITYVLNPLIPPNMSDSTEIKYLANAILITSRPPSKSIIDRVGGMGKTVRWRITDTGVFENKLWAAKVTPVLDSEIIYTENPEPLMVLAMRKSARPTDAGRIRNWQPVIEDNALVFDATVGQKMALMIEEEHTGDACGTASLDRVITRHTPIPIHIRKHILMHHMDLVMLIENTHLITAGTIPPIHAILARAAAAAVQADVDITETKVDRLPVAAAVRVPIIGEVADVDEEGGAGDVAVEVAEMVPLVPISTVHWMIMSRAALAVEVGTRDRGPGMRGVTEGVGVLL